MPSGPLCRVPRRDTRIPYTSLARIVSHKRERRPVEETKFSHHATRLCNLDLSTKTDISRRC